MVWSWTYFTLKQKNMAYTPTLPLFTNNLCVHVCGSIVYVSMILFYSEKKLLSFQSQPKIPARLLHVFYENRPTLSVFALSSFIIEESNFV